MNGFLGMLNHSNAIHRVRHLWGVPIPPDKGFVKNGKVLPFYEPQYSTTSFVQGLLFHTGLDFEPSVRVTRIPTLPSWSWTGWYGPVSHQAHMPGTDGRHHSPSEVGVSIELKNGQLLDWGISMSDTLSSTTIHN